MGVPSWFLEDDEAFDGHLSRRRFEELRDTAQAAIELLDEQSISLDELAMVVRRRAGSRAKAALPTASAKR